MTQSENERRRESDKNSIIKWLVGIVVTLVAAYMGMNNYYTTDAIKDIKTSVLSIDGRVDIMAVDLAKINASNGAVIALAERVATQSAKETREVFSGLYREQLMPVRERTESNTDRLNEVIMMLRCYDNEHKKLNPAYETGMCLHPDYKR